MQNNESMTTSEIIVGLDIGTTKICAVVGEQTSTGIDIIGIGTSLSNGLKKGVVVNIKQTTQSIQKAILDAEQMAGCEISNVYAGIAGSHIKGQNSHGVIAIHGGGEVTQQDVERVLEAAKAVAIPSDRRIVHSIAQSYIVDDQSEIINPVGMTGVRLEANVHLVTASVTSAQNIIRSCNASGLDVSGIVLESLASSYAVLTDTEREIGVALIDIGGGSSDIAIFRDNAIKYTADIGLGGSNITNDIVYGLKIAHADADKIKIKSGCAISDLIQPDETIEVPGVGGWKSRTIQRRFLADICEARMEEIFANIYQELKRSGMLNQLGAGIVLTGGASLMQGCVELAEEIFQLPARVGYPRNVGGIKEIVHDPKYSTAVGLLFYAMENEPLNSPPEFPEDETEDTEEKKQNFFSKVLGKILKWFSEST